jgi:phenylalanyl-tRNA synthetase alpha chain
MIDRIEQIAESAREAITAAGDPAALEEVRVRFLGRKAELTGILRGIGDLDPAERGPVGGAANEARTEIEGLIAARSVELEAIELDQTLVADSIDVTLPGSPSVPVGHLHPVTRTRRMIEDVMVGLGYRVMEGPEIELDYYNFTALNHPADHPARMLQDTFYVDAGSGSEDSGDDVLLRTHTSPVQVRAMEGRDGEDSGPPLFIIVPGKTYRRDSDATHSPMFHQVEGLAVGEGLTLADLKGTLLEMLRAIFGEDGQIRMRPHFFPFTEPSVEFDVSCFRCDGTGTTEEARCSLCKGIGWIELGGAGMVDPNVFEFVRQYGYDSERVTGFAFGFGIERIAMLRHGIGDLRLMFDNDLRMLEQFS